MTLMCIDRSESPTHKGHFLQGGKSNLNQQQQNANHSRRNSSCSSPLPKESKRQQQLERSDSDSGSKRSAASNSSRYKTELCRPFEESGTCKYGDKCQFAHGAKELRSMARHPKYKTELCRTFHSTGLCPYGPRCHFIHNSEQTRKTLMTNLTTRPTPLTSLGSAGDVSPVSSHGSTPTSLKSFDDLYQSPMSPNVFDYSNLLSNFKRIADYPVPADLLDAINGYNDKVSGYGDKVLEVDNFGFQASPFLDLQPGPLTPNSPVENNSFRLAIFDGFLKL